MVDIPTDADHVRDAIRLIVDDQESENVMVGDLVLIAEVINGDGENQLMTLHNTEISRWKELGFLHDRITSIENGHFVLGGDDEDEEDDG